MYGIRVDIGTDRRTYAGLREYARLEYGDGYAEWILADAKRVPRRKARARFGTWMRQRLLDRGPSHRRPVPHKGSPREATLRGSFGV